MIEKSKNNFREQMSDRLLDIAIHIIKFETKLINTLITAKQNKNAK